MEWILWLCLLTFLISSTWAAFRISRRFLREDLPPYGNTGIPRPCRKHR
ncbi:MAG: hypothetical protein LIO74_02395 [Ruminococcus sp.]|nr:hypothetical protein [Ruminococcus sp.]